MKIHHFLRETNKSRSKLDVNEIRNVVCNRDIKCNKVATLHCMMRQSCVVELINLSLLGGAAYSSILCFSERKKI